VLVVKMEYDHCRFYRLWEVGVAICICQLDASSLYRHVNKPALLRVDELSIIPFISTKPKLLDLRTFKFRSLYFFRSLSFLHELTPALVLID
jgi:hypothetical protein